MFEGLVHRVLVGYLGRFVKDFQKDQLKLSLWKEEVLLENVELIPEAFDYLQLPFAIKQGRVGRLSIKIAWRKLGWDHPISIVLEDVFICVSQRDDQEWSLDAVERREFAGKKAQLAAAELAKLSKRVSDNQAGKSFFSHITAKVLDNIHVSIRDFHIQYIEIEQHSAHMLCGLKFSGLTLKQNAVGSSSGKVIVAQASKNVKVDGLEIYCSTDKEADVPSNCSDAIDSKVQCITKSEGSELDYLLQPLDMSLSLAVDRTGKLDNDLPRYSVRADIASLAMSLNEFQLLHLLSLVDYLNMSRLREKYGRYRPRGGPLSRSREGWQKLWWHYAQESILSDVHKRLRKTSWRYLGQRLSNRRKYIKLYKTKLEFLQKEQSIDESILGELERMEKDSDLDDILSYRSAAESELQEVLSSASSLNSEVKDTNASSEKYRNNEHPSGTSRGWLNWLSRGMLGAGGTDDSGQFSGVVSDDIVKDIFEATKFHPSVVSGVDTDVNDKILTCAVRFSIQLFSATLKCKNLKIADLILKDAFIEVKIWEDFAAVICFIKSAEMVYPGSKVVILHAGGEDEPSSCEVHVDVALKQQNGPSVKVMIQPLKVNCDMNFLPRFMQFLTLLRSFEFQHDRVLLSLNDIQDVKTRLLSKAEYILASSNKKINWDVHVHNIIIAVSCEETAVEQYTLVLDLGSIFYSSRSELEIVDFEFEERLHILKQLPGCVSSCNSFKALEVEDLYNCFDVKLYDFELKLMSQHAPKAINVVEKFSASVTLASCIISDVSLLKKLQVYVTVSSLEARFSPLIYKSAMELIAHVDVNTKSDSLIEKKQDPRNVSGFGFSLTANLESVRYHVDISSDEEKDAAIVLYLTRFYVRYSHTKTEACWVYTKALKVVASPLRGENDSDVICSSGNQFSVSSADRQECGVAYAKQNGKFFEENANTEEVCFMLHYEGSSSSDSGSSMLSLNLSDTDIHCHPHIVGLLIGFFDKVGSYKKSSMHTHSFSLVVDAKAANRFSNINFERFGYSNFFETGSSDDSGISLDCFPFVTICNSGHLQIPESLVCYPDSDWRNYFELRDRKNKGQTIGTEQHRTFHALSSAHPLSVFGISCDINISGFRVHLHDSSSIVGTITIPTLKSYITSCGDYLDLLCSTEGLIITSSWWSRNYQEFLWGPSLSYVCPIFNLRVRKGIAGLLSSQLEVSLGIQHACCVLPSEYLAILIGYFSLPEWGHHQPFTGKQEHINVKNKVQFVYKVEVLDSVMLFPVDQVNNCFLKTELKQLYCSFIETHAAMDLYKNIPPDCIVPVDKLPNRCDCLNLFGKDLLISFLWCKDDQNGCLVFDQDTRCDSITLIAPLSADIWVRLPCKTNFCFGNSSISRGVMARIYQCQVVFDDCFSTNGFEALMDVVDQFSSVDDESKGFTSDVSQFLQLSRSQRKSAAVVSFKFNEIKCCVDSLSVNFCRSKNVNAPEPVIKMDLHVTCSACVLKRIPIRLDLGFSSFVIYSLLNSLTLAQCPDSSSAPSALDISFSKSVENENELHLSLPSLELWLQLSDWIVFIDILKSVSERRVDSESKGPQSSTSAADLAGPIEIVAPPLSDCYPQNVGPWRNGILENIDQNPIALIVRSENIGLMIHLPISTNDAAPHEIGVFGFQKGCQNVPDNLLEGEHCKFISVGAYSRNSELSVLGENIQLKFMWGKVSGTIGSCKDKISATWPFFQITEINTVTDISYKQAMFVNSSNMFQCEKVDVWLSHRVFCFWYGVKFEVPESKSSNSLFGGMDCQAQFVKLSVLVSDERWSCGGPLLEMVMRNFISHASMTENSVEMSIVSDYEVVYNNIHKVCWEPFIEPWKLQINFLRKNERAGLLNGSIMTDVHLTSTAQLNLNISESVIECVSRTIDMLEDATALVAPDDSPGNHKLYGPQFSENIYDARYAPYLLQNLTSLPLIYHIYEGVVNGDEFGLSEVKGKEFVQPGASVPIYLNETHEEQLFRYRRVQSSDILSEKQSGGVVHRFMKVQLDATSVPSNPISVDLVGLTYFEVDIFKASNRTEAGEIQDLSKYEEEIQENAKSHLNSSFIIPVVFDVSVQRYNKLIRLYSTVILLNSTSLPLELRFDIPFGVSPKILDPIHPGEEFPLPLHLAEAGRIRWRPLGNTYLWSEVYDLSSILSQENKIGFLRSFICYPSLPSSDPFRCCVSVQNYSLAYSGNLKESLSLHANNNTRQFGESSNNHLEKSKTRFIHQVTLSVPLVVNNYLSDTVSLKIESGGLSHAVLLSEVKTSFHHIDPSHDLDLEFSIHGYGSSTLKFPRAEIFSTIATYSGTKFSVTETLTFGFGLSEGPLYVSLDKVLDPSSGARELFIFVPFLLYNCTGLPLNISDAVAEMIGSHCTLPSCYNLLEQKELNDMKHGLSLLSSDQGLCDRATEVDMPRSYFLQNRIIVSRKNAKAHLGGFISQDWDSSSFSKTIHGQKNEPDLLTQETAVNSSSSGASVLGDSNLVYPELEKMKAFMYSPRAISSADDIMVKVSRCLPEYFTGNVMNSAWSSPFLLSPPSGSSMILVPQLSSNAAYLISVTSSAFGGSFGGRTRAITFQPRYVICNSCSRDIYYKQKGTGCSLHLGIRQHAHLHWTDTRRELLVSLRFDEPGWQWSGSFLPDHLGDTQVKMRNHVSGAIKMIRVEVQNADVSTGDDKVVGSLNGSSGTNLILLSEDDMGFMPYRIDNFSKETLRIYQPRCETSNTVIYPYTSCCYAWDEPCYPHRLNVEIPGDRVVGVYALDDPREYGPVFLKSSSEKPERSLLVTVHAEKAIKVLSIVDSSYHITAHMKDVSASLFRQNGKNEGKQEDFITYREKFTLALPYISISLINSYPQELLFACARNVSLNLLQSVDQQKLSFEISSMQVDNQLQTTPYPVILSFNQEYRSNVAGQKAKDDTKSKIDKVLPFSEMFCEPVLCLTVATWRKKDISLVSFEHLTFRVADFCLELEHELVLGLLDFFKSISSRFQSRFLQFQDRSGNGPISSMDTIDLQIHESIKARESQPHGIHVASFHKIQTTTASLPSVVPIGAPWQQIHLLARRQRKIYIELFDLAPIKFSLSFSSAPWILRSAGLTPGESLINRGLVALANVEGAQINLKQLTVSHQMGSWASMKDILIRHYSRQLIHETYKVFGSAGVIGNPMGFARNLRLGIKDFLSAPAKSIFQSPTGLFKGMAQGTTSLVSNTVYAVSDAATQFSKAAHKGIVAFTFDDQSVARMEKQQKGEASQCKGVINEVLEGLTGLLQSPIKEVEKHGLPGVLSGIVLGMTGLVARPAASILEVTGQTAQSIRNRSKLYQGGSRRYRIRLPRPLSRVGPLRPYSLEEAIGTAVLMEVDNGSKLKEEELVMCKSLKQAGKFVIITQRRVLIVGCSDLVNIEKPEFQGVPVEPEWVFESEIGLDSIIHTDTAGEVVHVVGSNSDSTIVHNQNIFKKSGGMRTKCWTNLSSPMPFFQTNLELTSAENAQDFLQTLLSVIELGKEQGWGRVYLLHQTSL